MNKIKLNKGYGPDDTPDDIAMDTGFQRLEDMISRDRGDEREVDRELKGYVFATYSTCVSLLATLAEHPDLGAKFLEDFKRHLAHFENTSHLQKLPPATVKAFRGLLAATDREVQKKLKS